MRGFLYQGSHSHGLACNLAKAGVLEQDMGVLLSHSQAGVEWRVPEFVAVAESWSQRVSQRDCLSNHCNSQSGSYAAPFLPGCPTTV